MQLVVPFFRLRFKATGVTYDLRFIFKMTEWFNNLVFYFQKQRSPHNEV